MAAQIDRDVSRTPQHRRPRNCKRHNSEKTISHLPRSGRAARRFGSGGKLQDALTKSRSLIVICSPKSAVSKWVNEEVKTYKSFGYAGRLFCLITDGEPNAAPDSGLLECFPPAVRFQVSDDQLTSEPAEPIAADARPGKDGKTSALLKLLSGVMGVGYDELRRRERQRQRQRRMRFAALGVVAMFLMAVVYVAVADVGLNLPGGMRSGPSWIETTRQYFAR